MTKSFGDYLGKNPALYGRDLVKSLGVKEPPIDENEVVEFLGYEIKEVTVEETSEWPDLQKIFQISCAHLFKQENLILINSEMAPVRKRTCAFHECGHDITPWHIGLNFACTERTMEPFVHQSIEREAFLCGAEMMMPHHLFVPDMLSLSPGLDAIKALSFRYNTSLESTAIRYTKANRNLCAIVVIESSEKHGLPAKPAVLPSRAQLVFPFQVPYLFLPSLEAEHYPLRVKYCAKSPRFPQYILPGRGIRDGNPIFEAWATRTALQAEIPASIFRSSALEVYHAEMLPLSGGDLMVFLWLPDHQYTLRFDEKAIL